MKKAKTITNKTAKKLISKLNTDDRLILQLGIETGLRISDILKLKKSDISNPLVVIEKKTKRCREINISDRLCMELRAHAGSAKYIFHGKQSRTQNKSIHRTTFHRRLKKYGADWSAHSMRKLYAQNAFQKTGNIFAVQKLMNHKYVTTTAAYLDIDVDELLKQIQPRGDTDA